MNITDIDIEVLDGLAYWLAQKELRHDEEEVFLVVYHRGRKNIRLHQVPNESPNPKDHYDLTVSTWDYPDRGDQVIGCVHTHRPREGNEMPSERDYPLVPEGFLGGVYMPGHHTVYWHDKKRIFRHSLITTKKDQHDD